MMQHPSDMIFISNVFASTQPKKIMLEVEHWLSKYYHINGLCIWKIMIEVKHWLSKYYHINGLCICKCEGTRQLPNVTQIVVTVENRFKIQYLCEHT
jgi:hypothetical protein